MITEDCTLAEFCKFKRDFATWMNASYPDGYLQSEMRAAFMSSVDAGWQQRADATSGMENSDNPASLWFHCDAIMLILLPLHTQRMLFLGTKPDKGMKLSAFLQRLKEEAKNAEINTLTESSLVLYIFTANTLSTLTGQLKTAF